jgi:hypothetical protein
MHPYGAFMQRAQRTGMDHFTIVQALCRAAIADASPALRKQIERLRDALTKDGESKQAAALMSILTTADRTKELSPSRIERSKAQIPGEVLTRNTPVPVDRETAAPLADVLFPADVQPVAPLFNATVSQAIGTIIEEWANFDALSEIDIRPSKTCLIYGAPGTGKTRLALWIPGDHSAQYRQSVHVREPPSLHSSAGRVRRNRQSPRRSAGSGGDKAGRKRALAEPRHAPGCWVHDRNH